MNYSVLIATIALFFISATCERAGTEREAKIYKDSTVVEYFRRTSGWVAGDGAFSIPLSDGRTLWVMGDSHINAFNPETGTIPCVEDKETGYVYAYGHRFSESRSQNDLYIARFSASDPELNWEAWDGESWTGNYQAAKIIKENANSTPMVCKIRGKYLLVNSEFSVGCDQGNEIYVSVAENPTGPFSEQRSLHTIDDTLQGHYPFFYVPVAHPQFINDQDELLITYNVNGYGTCVEGCQDNKMDPDHYRPRGIRVPLKLIDPEF